MSHTLQRSPCTIPGSDLPAECAFGEGAACLEVDFRRTDRAALVTDVLAACVSGDGWREALERLSVSRRVLRLIKIAALTEGRASLSTLLRCRACGTGDVEAELPVEALEEMQMNAEATAVLRWTMPEGGGLSLRRPTGLDQYGWRALATEAAADRAAIIAGTLVIDGEPPAGHAWVAGLAEALAAFDPLTAFRLSCQCPSCGVEITEAVNLSELALKVLERHQRALLRTVHRLATAYGWTEAAVMSVPSWRRESYLEMITGTKLS